MFRIFAVILALFGLVYCSLAPSMVPELAARVYLAETPVEESSSSPSDLQVVSAFELRLNFSIDRISDADVATDPHLRRTAIQRPPDA